MPLSAELGAREVALRLALTVLAGMLFGLNREGRGGAAGLRTTILVCLAASVAMIQANLLLPTTGRPNDSFVVLDLMRLPLGILSGVGFLGAGVIFRRGDLVTGVTTAAILWFSTVIGLCFGGGQLALGVAATVMGSATLWGFKWLEGFITHELRGTLVLKTSSNGPTREQIAKLLRDGGFKIAAEAVHHVDAERESVYDVRWRSRRYDAQPPRFVAELAAREGVRVVRWRPQGVQA